MAGRDLFQRDCRCDALFSWSAGIDFLQCLITGIFGSTKICEVDPISMMCRACIIRTQSQKLARCRERAFDANAGGTNNFGCEFR